MARFVQSVLLSGLFLLGALSSAAAATVEMMPGDDVEGAINAAMPGDEIVLAGGTYELTERFGISVAGTADAPIVIRAKEGEKPNLHRQGADQNVIDVDDAMHVVFRGLEISGGSHGLRLVNASFVTIEDCEIHDTADVALSANSGDEYEGLRILRNHIHDTDGTGEGMYLGCNADACRMFDSLIEGNYVHHTNASTVVQGDGIEIKEGSYNNIVRDNVIHDTNYPCILSYSTAGNGAPNIIERNVLWNCGDHAIQSAADAVIRNNIILGAAANGIAMQPHQSGAPSNLIVVHNTVLNATNDAISARGITGSVVIANNALYAPDGSAISVGGELGQLTLAGNYGVGAFDGASGELNSSGDIQDDFVAASFSGALPNDVFPAPGSGLIGAGNVAHLVVDDFNGTPRRGVADVGAYAFDASGNPGWPLGAGPKSAPPVAGAGAGGAAGTTGGAGGEASGGAGVGGTRASGGVGAGVGGMQASAGDGEPGASGSLGGPMPSGDEGGCGCRVEGGRRAASVSWLAALMLVGLTVERRRRSGRALRA